MDHAHYMDLALTQAELAFKANEIPIGALLVNDNQIVAQAHNLIELQHDASAHAEMLVLQHAAKIIHNRRLNNSTLYVTLEPCAMCSWAILQFRVTRVVFGVRDWQQGGLLSNFSIATFKNSNHKIEVIEGIRELECKALLDKFFQKIRTR